MLPKGVLMSTLSLPFSLLLLEIVHPEKASKLAAMTAAKMTFNLFIPCLLASAAGIFLMCRCFHSCIARCNSRNRYRQVAMDGDVAKQGLHCMVSHNLRVRESAHIVLHLSSILREVRITHRNHDRTCDGLLQNIFDQSSGRIPHGLRTFALP